MAVKVIKHGKTHYTTTCPRCGCEFEYDLKDLGVGNGINCPDCDYYCYHPIPSKIEPSPWYPNWPTTPNVPDPYTPSWPWDPITKPYVTWDSCEGCSYYQQLKNGKLPYTVGDSPCTWCSKHQPYVYTNVKTSNDFKWPKEAFTYTGPEIKVTLDGLKNTATDYSNLFATATNFVNSSEENKEKETKLDLDFNPEDIDLPQ